MIVQHFSKHYFYTLTPLSPLVIWIIFHFPSMPMSSPLQCNPVHSSAMWKSSERNKYLLKYAHSKRRGSRFGQKNSERFSSHFWQGLEPQTHTHTQKTSKRMVSSQIFLQKGSTCCWSFFMHVAAGTCGREYVCVVCESCSSSRLLPVVGRWFIASKRRWQLRVDLWAWFSFQLMMVLTVNVDLFSFRKSFEFSSKWYCVFDLLASYTELKDELAVVVLQTIVAC